ncbi:MAG: hypothetical protein WBQ30_16745, partial [Thermoanaerobaculia bacterium]
PLSDSSYGDLGKKHWRKSMSKKTPTRQHQNRDQDQWIVSANRSDKIHPKSGRRYLKDLDRELQRFLARVAGLEVRSAYDDAGEAPNLALEAEEMYREALILRTEIRECLAKGQASRDDVIESINDSWNQLGESFKELRSSLRQDRPAQDSLLTMVTYGNDDLDIVELDDDLYVNDDLEFDLPAATVDRRIHRPRGGPKR